MKHIFAVLVPLCIFCYFGYAVTYAVLGTKNTSTDTAAIEAYSISNNGSSVKTQYTLDGEYDSIDVSMGGYNVVIKAVDTDVTNVSVISDYMDTDEFTVEINGGTLCISSNAAGYYSIGSFVEGIAQAVENNDFSQVFTVSTAVVEVPNKIYENLTVDIGSGAVTMNDVAAHKEEFDISSGSLAFYGKDDFTADEVTLYLGSGKAEATNLRAQEYSLDISSGSFDINGLCGAGSLDMGSGKGTVEYSEYNGDAEFIIGSGSLDVILPNNANADITANLGSGVVKVNAAGKTATIRKSGRTTLGSGGAEMDISVGSGRVSIESKNYSDTNIVTTTVDFVDGVDKVDEVVGFDEIVELDGEIS